MSARVSCIVGLVALAGCKQVFGIDDLADASVAVDAEPIDGSLDGDLGIDGATGGTIVELLFEDGSLAAKAMDTSGHGHEAALSGVQPVTRTTPMGSLEQAAAFGGDATGAIGLGTDQLDSSVGFTVAAWVYLASEGGMYNALVSDAGGSFEMSVEGATADDRTVLCHAQGGDAGTVFSVSRHLGVNAWHFVACILDPTAQTLTIDVDGDLGSTPMSRALPVIVSTVQLGRYRDVAGSSLLGALDDIRIWPRPLSPAALDVIRQHD